MASFSGDFKEEVKEKIDIVDVVSDYVELKRSGKNYKGLCPFHQEKTPSFTVNPANQFYHCFGCNAGGDVFNFLMEIEHITFFESLKMAAERVGLELPNRSDSQKKAADLREKIFEINNLTARFYNYLLVEHSIGNKALDYLADRGIDDKDIENFGMGYAPDNWTSLYKFLYDKGYNKKTMAKAGLIIDKSSRKFYDRFRNRIIFPIFNSRGEVLAFGGRIIDDQISQPKYLNSPDTMVYDKGDNLYGLNWARDKMRQSAEAIIMEGYTDVLTAHKAGLENAVASLGTALTKKQAGLLNRYVSIVYIAYDADTAGARATLRGLEILKEKGLDVRVIQLPKNTDPDDFIKEEGKREFQKLKEDSLSLIEFKVDQVISSEDIKRADDKVNISHKIVDILANIDDSIERDVYSHEIAPKINMDGNFLLKEVEKKYKNNRVSQDKIKKNRYTKNVNKTKRLNSINEIERKIIKAFIDYPEYRDIIKDRISPVYFANRLASEIINILLDLDNNIDFNKLIKNIENKKIKDILMKLTVAEKKELNDSMIKSYLAKLIENYQYRYKYKIYKKLQNTNLNLEDLNSIFLDYQKISIDSIQKGGI